MHNHISEIIIRPFVVGKVLDRNLPSAKRTLGLHDMATDGRDTDAQKRWYLRAIPYLLLPEILGEQATIHGKRLLFVDDFFDVRHENIYPKPNTIITSIKRPGRGFKPTNTGVRRWPQRITVMFVVALIRAVGMVKG